MYFLLVGRDGKDEKALSRRLSARVQHLALAEENYRVGKLLYGVAMLDEKGNMIGSTMIFNFADHAELNQYLKTEPYVTAKVWQELEVSQCQPGSFFINATGHNHSN